MFKSCYTLVLVICTFAVTVVFLNLLICESVYSCGGGWRGMTAVLQSSCHCSQDRISYPEACLLR